MDKEIYFAGIEKIVKEFTQQNRTKTPDWGIISIELIKGEVDFYRVREAKPKECIEKYEKSRHYYRLLPEIYEAHAPQWGAILLTF